MLVPPPKEPEKPSQVPASAASQDAIVDELARLREEIAELREAVTAGRS
ncbi:MAG: hypothetical protein QG587_325, partial [Chloroflexota bacterium]|nr:hypothetical protein [Chloroflexota bacterium]